MDNTPTIFREGSYSQEDLAHFRRETKIWREVDIFPIQLKELFEITHASILYAPDFNEQCEKFIKGNEGNPLMGDWICFPWSGEFVHTVKEEDYTRLRTNRNRNLVTEEEQKKLLGSCVGLVGLSVGSNVGAALVYGGIANHLKLAEFDTLETTNLNRVRATISQIGMRKVDLLAQQLYEINPYLDISVFPEKMNKELLRKFMTTEPRPKVVFEIIDSFETKIHLRALAREFRIAVIMVTNLGDRVIMDVERYDLDPAIEYFNGRAGRVPCDILEKPDITDADKHKYAVDLAGVEHIPQRALESVAQIGKTLVGRPQLASTVMIAGGVSAYLTRKIILDQPLESASWIVDLDKIFNKESAI